MQNALLLCFHWSFFDISNAVILSLHQISLCTTCHQLTVSLSVCKLGVCYIPPITTVLLPAAGWFCSGSGCFTVMLCQWYLLWRVRKPQKIWSLRLKITWKEKTWALDLVTEAWCLCLSFPWRRSRKGGTTEREDWMKFISALPTLYICGAWETDGKMRN